MKKQNDSRYPYTYACDFIRGLAGYAEEGTLKLTLRSEAEIASSALLGVP